MTDEGSRDDPRTHFAQAANDETFPHDYVPEVKQNGEIHMRFEGDCRQSWPSFFYAPDAPYSRLEMASIRDKISKAHLNSLRNATFFVRDNVDGRNRLYSHNRHIYLYGDTMKSWARKYGIWTLEGEGRGEPNNEHETSTGSFPDSTASASPIRRVMVLAGWEEEANARLFCRVDLLPEFQPKFVRWTGYIGLQTCWYEIDNGSDLEHNQSWPSGTFYGSSYETFRTMNPLGSGKLKGVALNIGVTYGNHKASLRDQREWSCVVSLPRSSLYPPDDNRFHEPLLEMPLTLCAFVSPHLWRVVKECDYLVESMERLLAADGTIVDPKGHDKLLFDDEQFSRSRLYFWLLSSLATFSSIMEGNIRAWTELRSCVQALYPDRCELSEREVKALDAFDPHLASLEDINERAKSLNAKVLIFRDGLFNASAVLESRAANRLSENVKLLTYVSIFYLPLSFCASLWSTTETFSWNGLAIAMILVGIITYLVTFNLNQIVRIARKVYKRYRDVVLDLMGESADEYWHDEAARFRQFQPPRPQLQPTEWLILWFLVEKITAAVWAWAVGLLRTASMMFQLPSGRSNKTRSYKSGNDHELKPKDLASRDDDETQSTSQPSTDPGAYKGSFSPRPGYSSDAQHNPQGNAATPRASSQYTPHESTQPNGDLEAAHPADDSANVQESLRRTSFTRSRASETDENKNAENIATVPTSAPALSTRSQTGNTVIVGTVSPQIANILRRHSTREPDLEAGIPSRNHDKA